jgi:hypothetical protein
MAWLGQGEHEGNTSIKERQHLHAFLEQFAADSTEVLEYVGLLGDGLLAQARRGR